MGCRLIGVFLFFLLPSVSIRVTRIPVSLNVESKSEPEKVPQEYPDSGGSWRTYTSASETV